MKNGKSKGSKFERDVAKMLTKWISGSEKPYYFWRSANSGGLGSTINPDITGDLIALRPEGFSITDRFSIELKAGYPSFNWFKFLKKKNKSNELLAFWEQAVKDAEKGSKKPILIYKQDRQPIILVCEKELGLNYIKIKHNELILYCYNFEEVLSLIKPDMFK